MRITLVLALLLSLVSCTEKLELKVLQFNIWQEGTVIDGGFDAVVNEIIRTDADFITLSEVRNYDGTRFSDRIVAALKQKGETYHSFFSHDSGVISRFPLVDSMTVFPLKNDQGSIYKLVADVKGNKVSVYTAHLDYRNCAYYDVKGYNGSSWEPQAPVMNVDSVLVLNRRSVRDDAIIAFIKDAAKDIANGNLIILGGDFNEPSHLDWIEETKNSLDHQGLIIPWDVSTLLDAAGYKDSYRTKYPNPLTHPGITYPADTPASPINKLTWAPKADERERIDFIHYYPDRRLELLESVVVGPSGSIERNKRVQNSSEDKFIEPIGIWPTDHKALLTTFVLSY